MLRQRIAKSSRPVWNRRAGCSRQSWPRLDQALLHLLQLDLELTDDPQQRKTVFDLLKGAPETRIYPVGRLDRNTSGVLLLTNDGDLSQKLTSVAITWIIYLTSLMT